MVKNFLVFLFLFLSVHFFAQEANYGNIISTLKVQYPEIDFNEKLVSVIVWNSKDVQSREMNKEMYRVWQIYQEAKLTGGHKGVIFISISSDLEETPYTIARNKDLNKYSFSICDFKSFHKGGKLAQMGFSKPNSNVVYDSNGKLIFSNLATEDIFKSFNHLITR